MIHISTKNSVVTLINVFTVDPTNQQRLVELLTRATEVSVRHAPGFVSASLHRSLDGTKVTMYAQWRSVQDYQAMRQDTTPLPFLQEALTIATFEPGMYDMKSSRRSRRWAKMRNIPVATQVSARPRPNWRALWGKHRTQAVAACGCPR